MTNLLFKQTNKFRGLSKETQEDLVFDLINAFSKVKGPIESMTLLQDLLTSSEIKNISKRLRIAKLLLANEKYDSISAKIRTSHATVAKVKAWLDESGYGLKRVIKRLPQRTKGFKPTRDYYGYNPFELGIAAILNRLEKQEKETLRKFLNQAANKDYLFQEIQEKYEQSYRHGTSLPEEESKEQKN